QCHLLLLYSFPTRRSSDLTLDEYFEQEPPKVWILGKGKIYSLETNIQIELNGPTNGKLRDDQITKINWAELNVNIRRESQGKYKDSTSIQYTMINKVLKKEDYQIIFDDDGTGEVADIVAIKEMDDVIEFDFFQDRKSTRLNSSHVS